MKTKKLILCLCSLVIFASMNSSIFGDTNIDNDDTYTSSEIITYETPEWTKRADIIGTVTRQVSQPILNNNLNLDYTNWKIGESEINCTAGISFYESFEKKYSGYNNIQFLAKTYEGHELSTKLPSGKTKSIKYFFDYNEQAQTYLPSLNAGYDESGQTITLDASLRNRTEAVMLQETNYNATTDYEVVDLSLQDIGITSDAKVPYGNNTFNLNSTQHQPFVVASLHDQDKVTISYDRTMELPVTYFDNVRKAVSSPSKDTSLSMQLGGTLLPIVRVKYAYDTYLKIQDLHDQKVNVGDPVTFTSNVSSEFAGDVAEDEKLPSSTSYYEVSNDNGRTWTKINNSDNNNTLELTATLEMNDNLYRHVAVGDDAKHTTVASNPGKLSILNYDDVINKNNDKTEESIIKTPALVVKEKEPLIKNNGPITDNTPNNRITLDKSQNYISIICDTKKTSKHDIPLIYSKPNRIHKRINDESDNSNIGVPTGDSTNINILLSLITISGIGIIFKMKR